MFNPEIPSEEKNDALEQSEMALRGPQAVEVFKIPDHLAGMIDLAKIDVVGLEGTAEMAIKMVTDRIAGRIDPVLALTVLHIAVGCLAAGGGADIAAGKMMPQQQEIVIDRIKKTELYQNRIAPAQKNILNELEEKRSQLGRLRSRIQNRVRPPHSGPSGTEEAAA